MTCKNMQWDNFVIFRNLHAMPSTFTYIPLIAVPTGFMQCLGQREPYNVTLIVFDNLIRCFS